MIWFDLIGSWYNASAVIWYICYLHDILLFLYHCHSEVIHHQREDNVLEEKVAWLLN